MLRPLQSPDVADMGWLDPFVSDFRGRFMTLLAGERPLGQGVVVGWGRGGQAGTAGVSKQHLSQSVRLFRGPPTAATPHAFAGQGLLLPMQRLERCPRAVPPRQYPACALPVPPRPHTPRPAGPAALPRAGAFREFPPALVLSLLDPKLTWSEAESAEAVSAGVVVTKPGGAPLSPYDLKRLQVCREGGG